MDACSREDKPDHVPDTRLPAWFRPAHVRKEDWARWRPDIAILPDIRYKDLQGKAPCELDVFVFETGYCSDTSHDVKFIEKMGQHQAFIAALRKEGYRVHVCITTLGTTGTIPCSLLTSMSATGITLEDSLKLAGKLHKLATHYFPAIKACRRTLEKQDPG